MGPGTWKVGPGTWKPGHGSWDLGHGRWDLVHGSRDMEHGVSHPAGQSLQGSWSKHAQWLVKVSGVTAIATDCLANSRGS